MMAEASVKMVAWTLITGANRGIGLQLAKDLVRQGRAVIIASRTQAKGRDACTAITAEQQNAKLHHVQLDVSDASSIEAAGQSLKDGGFQLSTVINNAGIYKDTWSPTVLQEHLTTNVHGPIRVIEAMLPVLMNSGRIVNVSSGYGQLHHLPKSYQAAITTSTDVNTLATLPFYEDGFTQDDKVPGYKVSKAALNRVTQLYAADHRLTSHSINITACCPGWVRTDMGGSSATRSPAEGASSILKQLEDTPLPTGGFYRDGKVLQL